MTLDGLLAAIRFEETGAIEVAHADLPLANTDGLWHASGAIFEPMDKARVVFIAGFRPGHSIDPDLIKKNTFVAYRPATAHPHEGKGRRAE